MYKNNASPHNSNYVEFYFLHHQPQPLNLSAVFGAGGHYIDPGCVNAAVPQDVRQFRNILLNAIESPGKELAQIVWKDFGRVNARRLTQPFHLCPNVAAVQGLAVSGDEDSTASDTALLSIIQ